MSSIKFTCCGLTTKYQALQQPLLMDEGGAPYFSDEKFCMGTNGYNNNASVAQEFYMETHDYYNNPTPMVPMTQESYMEAPYYYTNPTTMASTAQEYMGTTYYINNHTAMAQGSYMETPYYSNNSSTTMVPMAQEYYSFMGTTYYNNHTAMVQGSYMDNPYYTCSNNTSTTMVPTAQDYHMYTGTTYYNSSSTTVVPLTQEWVSRLQTNMSDGYGPSMIMEKFLTSLPDCERETPAYHGSVQEHNPEVGENVMRLAQSESCNRSEMTEPEAAPPGDIGQDCSNDDVKSPPCLSRYNNHTSDVEKGLQEADLHHNLDIDDWIMLLGSEAGSVYYSDDEILEEMTGDNTGPDGDSMEERQALTTSSVPGRLVDKLSDYTAEKIQIYFELDHQSVSGLEDLEEIQFLDQIELDHQSLGTGDPEEIQLLDFIDHQSDDVEEKFQLSARECDSHTICMRPVF
ncbi:Hypp4656 [Branchiostoma lanceolatum]|uniref:Hypp4656 protein n=1 Tax=Branchiostoma lanceolatum TaxID=7740 RepID=A0A8K0A8U7_BRALA|nr:Hypp4656 [Branchiostoma lanceolatum]